MAFARSSSLCILLSDHHIIVLNAFINFALKIFSPKLKGFACFQFSNIVRFHDVVHYTIIESICQIFKHKIYVSCLLTRDPANNNIPLLHAL